MSNYQAKVYSALASNGPSGVAEIQKVSGVPRTKIYEILEQLLDAGTVEFQSGRPIIYNALSPTVLVDRMRKSYLNAADDATRLLAEMQQIEKSTSEDLVWTVKGKAAVRRKSALTIASAQKSILMVEQYPHTLIMANMSILKSLAQKKLNVRVVCILKDGQPVNEKMKTEDFIEFRKVTNLFNIQGASEYITDAFRQIVLAVMARNASLIVVDDQEAFVHLPNNDDSKSAGLTLKIPGLPLMQRILFERIVQEGTMHVR
jgi:sugar-specific transcriptional regulator TrmB